MAENMWFEYPIRVYPHHTDYGKIVWHGQYIAWMEEARVDVLRRIGMPFETFVESNINLVVADLSLRYRQPLLMGYDAVVLAYPHSPRGVRLPWEYELRSPDRSILYMSGTLHLAIVDDTGRLYRRMPPQLQQAYERIPAAAT